jgi:hypothetical protein
MARPRKEQGENGVDSSAPVLLPELTEEQLMLAVEKYLGVHPRYFIYAGTQINVDIWNLNNDRQYFNGFLPHCKQLGII